MIRKSAIALALLLLTVPLRLFALGLGEIEMQSALNQPMRAAISLTSVAGMDISQIRVALASREEHERLGLSRAKILSDFKFEVTEDGRGKPVIYISSFDAVREPFLEFLLEMVWENGRMVREYTVLVDPPVTMPAIPVAPVAPVVEAPVLAPPRVEPIRQVRPTPAPQPAPITYRPAPVEKRAADSYGPVRREEALWGIAKRLRPDSNISVQQMMIALLRANPQAFTDNNINNLKAGATLKIPDRDAILALPRGQAIAEAGRQYNEWRDKRNAARAAVKARTVAKAEPAAEAEPVVEEPRADMPVSPDVAVVETETQLKLTPPEGAPVTGLASSGEAGEPGSEASGEDNIRQQLALAAEEIEAGKAQSDELQSRVLELESQIAKMQRLLELKSDELASMQNRSGIQPGEPAVSDEGTVAATEAGDVTGEVVAAAEEAGAADGMDSFVSKARGIVNWVMENPVLAGLGVLVAMLLGGFTWGSMRSHSSRGMFDEEATLDKQFAAGSEDASASAQPPFKVSDPGTYDEDVEDVQDDLQGPAPEAASDPVTEADVYLAYGRVHQAEDVLQAALEDDPANIAIRAKLLEVLHAAGNVASFDIAASEYRELAPEDDAQWTRIATLGYELSPGNELYSSAKQPAGEADDFDIDLTGLNEIASQATVAADVDELDLAMDAEAGKADELPESYGISLDEAGEDEAHGEGLLASTDEVATKLDLARAYLDMEDPEGARSILQEVIEEGSAEQKSEAESLISKIV